MNGSVSGTFSETRSSDPENPQKMRHYKESSRCLAHQNTPPKPTPHTCTTRAVPCTLNLFKNMQWISQRIQWIGPEARSSQMPRRDISFGTALRYRLKCGFQKEPRITNKFSLVKRDFHKEPRAPRLNLQMSSGSARKSRGLNHLNHRNIYTGGYPTFVSTNLGAAFLLASFLNRNSKF